jgi:hypothetical protein
MIFMFGTEPAETFHTILSKREQYCSQCGRYQIELFTPKLAGDIKPYWIAVYCVDYSLRRILRDDDSRIAYFSTRADAEKACQQHYASAENHKDTTP